jgi:outer membrane protein assembly factor BamD (BamD/ComL family)
VVKFFLTRKMYDSAEARARWAVAAYPDAPATPALLAQLVQALEKQGKRGEAETFRKTLEEKYPGRGGKKR